MAVLTSISTFKQSLTGSAFEALAAVSGDSLSIIAFPDGSRAYVEEIISGNSASKMEVAVFSPRFGDNQYGLRVQHQFNPTLSGRTATRSCSCRRGSTCRSTRRTRSTCR
jgi:hypothetical protein